MKYTAKDPRKSGSQTDTQYGSIQDIVIGSRLKEDSEHLPYTDTHGRVHIYVKSSSMTAKCPYCGYESNSHHGIIHRNPQWIPLNGSPTVAHIRLWRYRCRNHECAAKTFVEELPELSVFRQSSNAVLFTVFAISMFCSASATEIICRQLGIEISHDSVQRLYSNIKMDDDSDVEEIGVDDISRRRGREYNTAVYESKTHRLLALLNGRDGKELKQWLEQHPKVRRVARDRASAYATAIREILSECMQVADRFHLLQNLMERMKDLVGESIPQTINIDQNGDITDGPGEKEKMELISQVDPDTFGEMYYNNDPVIDEDGRPVTILVTRDLKARAEHRIEKMQKVAELKKELKRIPTPDYRQLSEKYGLSIPTIKKYSRWTDEQVKGMSDMKRYSKPDSHMNQFDNIVYKMLRDGISPDETYCRTLSLGYAGSLVTLRQHIDGISFNHFGMNCGRKFGKIMVKTGIKRIRRADIIKYITIRDKEKMEGTAVAEHFDTIVEKYPKINRLIEIWNDGYSMVMGRDKNKVDEFITKYRKSEIVSFVKGLETDIEAVKNGVVQEMSSGFVEGNNCKYKLIKRTMYGRASTDTLMKKFYVASKICRIDISAKEILQLKVSRKYISRRPLGISCR